MANIFDLTGTDVAINYRKVAPSTQLGTRALRIVTVTFGTGGDSDIDLTRKKYDDASSGYVGTYTDSDSYYSKAVLQVQNYFETWAVGTPSATAFTVIVSDDTAQDSDPSTNVIGGYGQLEAALAAAVGIGNKAGGATNYNGTVTCATVSLSGASLA